MQHMKNAASQWLLQHCRLEKLPSMEVGPTALAWPMILTLIYDPDLQSPANYGHDLLTQKSSKSTVSQFRRQSKNKQMNGWTDRQMNEWMNKRYDYFNVRSKADRCQLNLPHRTKNYKKPSCRWGTARRGRASWNLVKCSTNVDDLHTFDGAF